MTKSKNLAAYENWQHFNFSSSNKLRTNFVTSLKKIKNIKF